jgi:hypothetical protein
MGNLYGTANTGGKPDCDIDGSSGCGLVFGFATDGTETVLYDFDDNDGGYDSSEGPLVRDGHKLYGTTWQGATGGDGTIYETSK